MLKKLFVTTTLTVLSGTTALAYVCESRDGENKPVSTFQVSEAGSTDSAKPGELQAYFPDGTEIKMNLDMFNAEPTAPSRSTAPQLVMHGAKAGISVKLMGPGCFSPPAAHITLHTEAGDENARQLAGQKIILYCHD